VNTRTVPVVIVGAGPTGLTAAALLAQYGVECLVLDRRESPYSRPRAVHLDDEVYRILDRLGLGEQFAAISWPGQGLRLVDRDLRVLAEFARDATDGKHGYPQANMFDQPELEAILRAGLARCDTVTLRGGSEVVALTQHEGGVRVDLAGQPGAVLAQYVLGCDGAGSLVRTAIGATMKDLNFAQRWLVVDVATNADIGQWEGVHQVCDPGRPGTFMRIGKTRYRWEFRLAGGETADDYAGLARLHPLIAPWTPGIPAADLEVIRVAEYTFRAQLADRWRDRRVLLLGDAAHLTPPFTGQGMGAGLRDAMNLAWKLAGVLDGSWPDRVLDSYQAEREPHARALIRLAKLIGAAMTQGGEAGNLLRRVAAPRLRLVPGLREHVLDSQTPALRRSDLVLRHPFRRTLAGSLCPNLVLPDGRRFDDAAAGRFAVVTLAIPAAQQRDHVRRRGAVLLEAAPGTGLYRWLRQGRADAAIVRPDGAVLRSGRDLAALIAALPASRVLTSCRVLTGYLDLGPQAAVEVEVVALGLARSGVADVGVQRVPVVGRLQPAVRPLDGAQLACHARAGLGITGHRWPVQGTRARAPGGRRGVGSEPVQRPAGGVREHGDIADRGGFQGHCGAVRDRRSAARAGLRDAEHGQRGHRDGTDRAERQRHGALQPPGQPARQTQRSCRRRRRSRSRRRTGYQRGYRQDAEGGHLDQPGGDPGPGADALEPEQAAPGRHQVGAESEQREQRARGRGKPAAGHQHQDRQGERHDNLQQEQPADGGDGPVPGEVKLQVDAAGHGQQQRSRSVQPAPQPAGRLKPPMLARAHQGPPRAPGQPEYPRPDFTYFQWVWFASPSARRGRGLLPGRLRPADVRPE
jgi:3-(3-hydroxy-phenyl)propionate hydroxylase